MFEQKEIYKLPSSATIYAVAKTILIITLISLPFSLFGAGFSMWRFMIIVIGLPVAITTILKYRNTNFSIDGNKIVMNWGVFSSNSRTILSENIQNATLETGLLMKMFSVSVLKIWTSSQSQIVFNRSGSSIKPDGLLILKAEDAVWLNEYLISKK